MESWENINKKMKSKENKYQTLGFLYWPYLIIYRSILLESPLDNMPGIIKYNDNEVNQAHELVDFLSFVQHSPIFLNENFDKKIRSTFEDIISSSDDCDNEEIFKIENKNWLIKIPNINNPELFSLYNSALKQSDPFAKCIFLFRIVEYFHEYIFKQKTKTEDFVNDLIPKILKYRFYPLYKQKGFLDGDEKTISNVLTEWKINLARFYKQNKNIYGFVYLVGRCGIAHGRGNRTNILYHTKKNYEKINFTNIYLELISRYLIEKHNANLIKILNYTKKTVFPRHYQKGK